MKVLIINKFLYNRGGDAIVALNTGELLEKNEHEVVFWGMKNALNKSFAHDDLFIDEIDLNMVGGVKNRLRAAGNMLYSYEAKRKVETLIERVGKPDIVHLHNFAHQISPSILDVFRRYNIPCVMTMHDYKMVCASYTLLSDGQLCEKCAGANYFSCFREGCVKDSKTKSLLNSVEMYLHHKIFHIYDHIDLFISPSRFLKDKVQAMGFKRPIEVLPNFVDISDEPDDDVYSKTICYVGRLSKEKGISTLLEAMKILPEIGLKIMGDGPWRKELENKVRLENLKNIVFLGHLSGNKFKEEIRSCRFSVSPSEWYENNPRSIIESFALAKPVIGSRIGGIPELVRDQETGLTFECGNATDLAVKIATLMSNPEQCAAMGKRARRWVQDELNSVKHYERLLAIYQRVINKRKDVLYKIY